MLLVEGFERLKAILTKKLPLSIVANDVAARASTNNYQFYSYQALFIESNSEYTSILTLTSTLVFRKHV